MSAAPFYLFRYRNLLIDRTLDAHREIIDGGHPCWWGWWQRPGEDARHDLWVELDKQVRKEKTVKIGLFNSDPDPDKGGGLVHLATVDQVIMPSRDHTAPTVPAGEREQVPAYYRDAPFSSAWLRLTNIEPNPVKSFFRGYSFERAPKLANINETDRDRFIGKLVLDPDELRSMDTTIWELRKAGKGDSNARILTATTHASAALESRPIPLRSNKILHITDLHFATKQRGEHRWRFTNEGTTTLQRQLSNSVDVDIGLVVITGDLTHWASRDEFYEAFRFIHGLLGSLKLGTDHLVMIPGNHDIAWTKQEGERWDPNQQVTEAGSTATAEYRDFYERVYRHPAASHLGMARRFVCPNGVCLEIGGINTSALETGPNWLAGMGRIADGAFTDVASALGWTDKSSMALRMLALHHHVTVVDDMLPSSEFSRGFGMAADAKKTLREAAKRGVHLILHGHRHLPYLGVEDVYGPLEQVKAGWALGKVAIVGGGSAGSTSVRDNNNYFNLIELHPSHVALHIYCVNSSESSQSDFEDVLHWTAPLRLDQGRLTLGDWEHVPR